MIPDFLRSLAGLVRRRIAAVQAVHVTEQTAREMELLAELPGYDRGPAAQTCIECQGVKPEKRILGSFPDADIGHRPTCWFAKKDKQVTLPAGALKVGDVVTLRVSFRPDGAPGYAVSMKSEPVDTTKDAVLSMTATKSEPARPEPRFKVGDKVVGEGRADPGNIIDTMETGGRSYLIRYPDGSQIWLYEFEVRPAPKFAVGEWVEWMSAPVSEGGRICSGPVLRRWFADLTNDGWWYEVPWRIRESDLTAQTPQHRHDCEGCVFLGRWDRFDLWHSPASGAQLYVFGDHPRDFDAKGDNPAHTEARRRAVARGLVISHDSRLPALARRPDDAATAGRSHWSLSPRTNHLHLGDLHAQEAPDCP